MERRSPSAVQTSHAYYRWLLLLPFVWQIGFTPVVNNVTLRLWSIPFPMLWQMLGVILTTAVIATVFAIDRRRGVDDIESKLLTATAKEDGAN